MGLPPPLRSGPREEVREGEGGGDIDRGDCLESTSGQSLICSSALCSL